MVLSIPRTTHPGASAYDDIDFDDPGALVQTANLAFLGDAVSHDVRSFLVEYADLGSCGAVEALSDAYLSSPAFAETYAATSDEALVRSVFFNLFDRNTDVEEVEYWTGALESDAVEDAALPYAVLGAARESDIEAYEAKLFIADYVTDARAEGAYVPDTLTTQSLHGNAELYAELAALDAESDDLSLDQAGTSLEGNPLYTATVGTGERELVFVTQQHGDEPIGTEAALLFLDFLISDDPEAQAIRDGATITVMPRVNPDGFARWELEADGVRGLTDPRLNENGQDLNRTYDPENPFSADFAPESAAVKEVIAEIDPDLVLDYHGQGNYRDDSGDLDTMSVLWPTNPEVSEDIRDTSKQAVVAIENALEEYDYDQLTLYPGSDNPAIARNGLSLDGTPGVLVEQRFLQEMFVISEGLDLDYSALTSALALEGFITMKGLASAAADGSLFELDPDLALEIPERSDSIEFAELYSDDAYVPEDMMAIA